MNAERAQERSRISAALMAERILLGALREQDAADSAAAARQRAEFLAEASLRFGASLDQELTYAAIAGVELPGLDAWCIVDVIETNGALRRLSVVHPDADKIVVARTLAERWVPDADDPIGIPAVRRAGGRLVIEDVHAVVGDTVRDATTRGILLELGVGPLLVVPIRTRGELMGAITFVARSRERVYASEELELAEALALRCAQSLEGARLYAAARAALLEASRSAADAVAARVEAEGARTEAEAARSLAEAANEAKARFLSTMSHELRTPLNAIAGYAQLMEMGIRGPVTPEQIADLGSIRRSQAHLLGLVDQVLQFARVEAGSDIFTLTALSLSGVVAGLRELVAPQMHAKQLRYSYEPGEEPLIVLGDEGKIRQIVLNLLANATKFTPDGGSIMVTCLRIASVTADGRSAESSSGAVRVTDTGPGIPHEMLESVFDPFVQVDRQLNTTNPGIGLGLAISRELARRMGGDLTASNVASGGCSFLLTLPLRH